jgi:exosortase A
MPPDHIAIRADEVPLAPWTAPLVRLAAAWAVLFILTRAEWRAMAHQWWDIDTYSHIILVPPILAWLVWLRRDELIKVAPTAWWPGLCATFLGLMAWLAGRAGDIDLVAQAGTVLALMGSTVTFLGPQAALVLAFPLAYALFLVPFGDEIVVPLQQVTARLAVGLTHASGVPATLDGFFIDTPAGRFVVAQECSGVKFLIAMIALSTLVAWTSYKSWRRRIAFVTAAAVVSILANGVRAWGTIYVAQYIGAERAGGFDHIIYGWVFFAVIVAAVLAAGWRFFEREPREAGLTAGEAMALVQTQPGRTVPPDAALCAIGSGAIGFAVLSRLV